MQSKWKLNLMLILCIISLMSIGFSSWIFTINSKVVIGTILTDDVAGTDFKDSAFVVSNSENGFDFYIYNGTEYYPRTKFSIEIKIRPDLLKERFNGEELCAKFGLKYSSASSDNNDIFSTSYTNLIKPKNAVCYLKQSSNRFINSDELVYSSQNYGTKTIYSLTTSFLLYSDVQPSIYSIAKDYQKNREYINLIISFDFELYGQLDENFKDITFLFMTNLPEEV